MFKFILFSQTNFYLENSMNLLDPLDVGFFILNFFSLDRSGFSQPE